jgi:hypothetical protein
MILYKLEISWVIQVGCKKYGHTESWVWERRKKLVRANGNAEQKMALPGHWS